MPGVLPVPRPADRHPARRTASCRCCSRCSSDSAGRAWTSPARSCPPDEYARYCRYLVARYGAGPVIYLVGADGSGRRSRRSRRAARRSTTGTATASRPVSTTGRTPTTPPPGRRLAGLPVVPDRPHRRARRRAGGGHVAQHARPRRSRTASRPTRAPGRRTWRRLVAGPRGLEQPVRRRHHGRGLRRGACGSGCCAPDEPGHVDYFLAPGVAAGGRRWTSRAPTAVGMVGRVLADLPTTDMRPGWQDVLAARCLIVPGTMFLNYATTGEPLQIISDHPLPTPLPNHRSSNGCSYSPPARFRTAHQLLPETGTGPRVTILSQRNPLDSDEPVMASFRRRRCRRVG